MRFRRSVALLGACAFILPLAAQAQEAQPAPPPAVSQPYTPPRLDHEAMTALLGPVAVQLETNQFAKARAAFERELAALDRRHGPQSMAAGDYIVAFAVTLFIAHGGGPEASEVMPLMERALAIYTARLGREHREVALILADIGNVGLALDPENPSARTLAAMEESHRIRTIVLGRSNIETTTTLANVAEVHGLPSRTDGQPALIEASAAMFRQAIDDFGTQITPEGSGAVSVRLKLARMYANNGL